VILADTSAWVEYLRATGSPVHLQLRKLIADEDELVTTEVVMMELLAGATTTPEGMTRLRRLLGRFDVLPVEGLADYEAAAELYRRCRRVQAALLVHDAGPLDEQGHRAASGEVRRGRPRAGGGRRARRRGV
jgi:predicted nucleic acid-binding protein